MANAAEEDYVVEAMPFYLNTDLAAHVQLFQFPHNPKWYPLDLKNIASLRIKPQNHVLELEPELDRRHPHIDALSDYAAHPLPLRAHYAPLSKHNTLVCAVSNGAVIGTFVDRTAQMRHSFAYIDRERNKRTSGPEEEPQDDTMDDAGESTKPTEVQVRFAKIETEKQKQAQEKSYAATRAREDAEAWVQLQRDAQTNPWLGKMHTPAKQLAENARYANRTKWAPERYLDLVNPPLGRDDAAHIRESAWLRDLRRVAQHSAKSDRKPAPVLSNVSRATIAGLSGADQVVAVMCNTQLLRFSAIMQLVTKVSEEETLQLLREIAVPVRGCWVLRSSILYGENVKLAACRDWLLLRFIESERPVTAREFLDVCGLPPEQHSEVLRSVAKKIDFVPQLEPINPEPSGSGRSGGGGGGGGPTSGGMDIDDGLEHGFAAEESHGLDDAPEYPYGDTGGASMETDAPVVLGPLMRPMPGWVFKLERDVDFEQMHSALIEDLEEDFRANREMIMHMIRTGKRPEGTHTKHSLYESKVRGGDGQSRPPPAFKKPRASFGTGMTQQEMKNNAFKGQTLHEQMHRFMQDSFEMYHLLNDRALVSLLQQRVAIAHTNNQLAVSTKSAEELIADAHAPGGYLDQTKPQPNVVRIRDLWIGIPSNENEAAMQRVILQLFRENNQVSKNEIQKACEKHHIPFQQNIYKKILDTLAVYTSGSSWNLKTGDIPPEITSPRK